MVSNDLLRKGSIQAKFWSLRVKYTDSVSSIMKTELNMSMLGLGNQLEIAWVKIS